MDQSEDRLADYVNEEPMVFMDCTGPEILLSGAVGSLTGLFTGILLGIIFNLIAVGVLLGVILSCLFIYGLMIWFKNVRQKHYSFWFKEKLFLFKVQTPFAGSAEPPINETITFGKGARRRG